MPGAGAGGRGDAPRPPQREGGTRSLCREGAGRGARGRRQGDASDAAKSSLWKGRLRLPVRAWPQKGRNRISGRNLQGGMRGSIPRRLFQSPVICQGNGLPQEVVSNSWVCTQEHIQQTDRLL